VLSSASLPEAECCVGYNWALVSVHTFFILMRELQNCICMSGIIRDILKKLVSDITKNYVSATAENSGGTEEVHAVSLPLHAASYVPCLLCFLWS
jgi:hypothetical protein